jgi:hypothetical protein
MDVAANPAHGRRIFVMAFAVLGLAVGIGRVRPQQLDSSRDAVILGPVSQASDEAAIATTRLACTAVLGRRPKTMSNNGHMSRRS